MTGRCGPCCSVDPIGWTTTACSFGRSAIWTEVSRANSRAAANLFVTGTPGSLTCLVSSLFIASVFLSCPRLFSTRAQPVVPSPGPSLSALLSPLGTGRADSAIHCSRLVPATRCPLVIT